MRKTYTEQQKELSRQMKDIRSKALLERFIKETSLIKLDAQKKKHPKGYAPPAFYTRCHSWEIYDTITELAKKLSMDKQQVVLCALMELIERVKK
jgi:hypothetical protein